MLGKHKTTFEFTTDKELTLNGDCIVGVSSNFEFSELKKFVKDCNNKIKFIINDNLGNRDEIVAVVNRNFCHETELVVRKSDYLDDRTFAIKADKAAFEINRKIIKSLENPDNNVFVEVKDA